MSLIGSSTRAPGTTERTERTLDVQERRQVDDHSGPAEPPGASWAPTAGTRFWLPIASAVALGAAIRVLYLLHGAPEFVLGDGFGYYIEGRRIADGLGYTLPVGDVVVESAHHPPGWVTLLAAVTEAGGASMRAHQVTGLIVGLGVIVVAGLVGRCYVSRRVGLAAAFLAAIYPGFWVLEVQILSEPLGLLIGGLLMLVLAHLWQQPSLALAVLAGGIAGALALVRSEQVLLLVIAVAPLLLLNGRISLRKRLAWTGIAALAAVMVIAPWTIYNLGRFEDPVILSTNMGGTVLVGNCPPTTYSGELLGGAGGSCGWQLAPRLRGLDQSQAEREYLSAAFDNVRDNIVRLPVTVLARHGRMLAVFRPAQTVDLAASWFGSERWPVWAWVTSFWLLVPLAVAGSVHLRRARVVQWPLLAPAVIALLVVTIAYGEPRYHTPADLGVVVLAAVGVDRLVQRTRRRTA